MPPGGTHAAKTAGTHTRQKEQCRRGAHMMPGGKTCRREDTRVAKIATSVATIVTCVAKIGMMTQTAAKIATSVAKIATSAAKIAKLVTKIARLAAKIWEPKHYYFIVFWSQTITICVCGDSKAKPPLFVVVFVFCFRVVLAPKPPLFV